MAELIVIGLTLSYPSARRSMDVLLRAGPDTPMSEVIRNLDPKSPGPWFIGKQRVDPSVTLAESGLVNGSFLCHGEPMPPRPHYVFELAVVGGPAAGNRFPLHDGVIEVGSNAPADIRINDRAMAPVNLRLRVKDRGVRVENIHGGAPVLVEGQEVQGGRLLDNGDVICVGETLFQIREPVGANADIVPSNDGHVRINRSPRFVPTREFKDHKLPQPPKPPEKQKFPWPQVVAPLVISLIAVALFHYLMFLLFALMSPILAVWTLYSGRKDAREKFEKETEIYEREDAKANKAIESDRRWKTKASRFIRPDPTTLEDIATLPQKRIWERRYSDDDFLFLRVGSTDVPADIKIGNGFDDAPQPIMYHSPVGVLLPEVGVLGISGANRSVRSLARWVLLQIAVLHSPSDVTISLFTSQDAEHEWSWLKWLPHVSFGSHGDLPFKAIAANPYMHEEHLKILLRQLSERKAAKERRESVGSAIVVVLDGVRTLREMPGVAKLLREGPEVGIYAIGLDDHTSKMALETGGQVMMGASAEASLRKKGQREFSKLIADHVDSGWTDRVARGIAPLKEVGGFDTETALPTSVRFVDMMNADLERPESLIDRWSITPRSTGALVGVSMDGPFVLDLKRDGPHGLVAGTTGSGKSEFLQTLVVSLALVNRPDSMNFLLVDYKGASAFAGCADLPHTVGLVTNLDAHTTQRALTSLDAELERREEVLRSFEASDVDIAWERDPDRAAAEGLARLVLVVDEFAELKQELPDFVDGLVRVARVGRSLGVHLILGTQRPTGVISQEIRANTGLRVALRMEDRSESQEVLDAPDAANIARSTPGRAYARLGGGAAIQPFQTARVAGRRVEIVEDTTPVDVSPITWNRLGQPMPKLNESMTVSAESTDLHAIVSMINKATQLLGVPKQRSPWLPPLGTHMAIPPPSVETVGDGTYAFEDLPEQQKQVPARYDVESGDHLIIAGAARSGRSTALRTLAAAITNSMSPDDCHLYVADFGNGALSALSDLPHCGAVVLRSERDRFDRLVREIMADIAHRQRVLTEARVSSINEQRQKASPADRLPFLVFMLDRWEGFQSEFSLDTGSDLPDLMHRIVREGPSVGIRVFITGDRSILLDRISHLVDTKLALHLNNKDDYSYVDLRPRAIADDYPQGRALRGTVGNDLQFALLDPDPSSEAQNAAIAHLLNVIQQRWPVSERLHPPFRVDDLPAQISLSSLPEYSNPSDGTTPFAAIVGIGGNNLHTFQVDALNDSPYFFIAGLPRTGRSTAAKTMALSILHNGGGVVTVCPKTSPLSEVEAPRFQGVNEEIDAFIEAIRAVPGPVIVVVDDLQAFAGNAFDEQLRAIVRDNPGQVSVIVVGGIDETRSLLSGIGVDARRSKVGLLFSPQSTLDGDLLGTRLPRRWIGRAEPGRAIFCYHGQVELVQIPQP